MLYWSKVTDAEHESEFIFTKAPHISPLLVSYGVSIVRIFYKIDRVITGPLCTNDMTMVNVGNTSYNIIPRENLDAPHNQAGELSQTFNMYLRIWKQLLRFLSK